MSSDEADPDNEAEDNTPTTKFDGLPTAIPVAQNVNTVTSSSNVDHADEDEDGDVDRMDLGSSSTLASATRPDSRVQGASRRGMHLILF